MCRAPCQGKPFEPNWPTLWHPYVSTQTLNGARSFTLCQKGIVAIKSLVETRYPFGVQLITNADLLSSVD